MVSGKFPEEISKTDIKSSKEAPVSVHRLLKAPSVVSGKRGTTAPRKKHSGGKKAEHKSLGAHIKHGLERGAKIAWDWAWRRMFGGAVQTVSTLQKQLTLAKRQDYLSVKDDGKDAKVVKSDSTRLLEQDIAILKTSIGRAFGNKSVRITLSCPFELASTVTSGVVNTVVTVRPSFSAEFSSLAALFEEYKALGGTVHFYNALRSAYAIGVTATSLNTAFLGICYDTTSAVLTSVSSATEYQQHGLYLNGGQSGSPLVNRPVPELFHFKIPDGIELGGSAYLSGTWVPTTVTAADWGYIKSYSVGTEVVALVTVAGVIRLDTEFRMRE
jgi:hypothetical protein